MRIVVDTNVLVSGVLNPHGPPGRIVDAILGEVIMVLHDDRVLSEYRAVLARPAFGFRPSDVDALLEFVETAGESIIARSLALRLPDPTDLPFLEVAASGHADALVTGNSRHFTPRQGTHAVTIRTPADFMSQLRTR